MHCVNKVTSQQDTVLTYWGDNQGSNAGSNGNSSNCLWNIHLCNWANSHTCWAGSGQLGRGADSEGPGHALQAIM